MAQPTQSASGISSARNPDVARGRSLGLDGLRGLAVLIVFVFHYGGGLQSTHWPVRLFGYATEAGWTGVVLFFALSGFLITGSLWDSRGSHHLLRNFYARRALRILPLYFLALVLAVLVALARGFTFADLHSLAIYALFLQDIPPFAVRVVTLASPLPLYHLWSVAVEEQFYLLWPALLLFSRTRRVALWLSLAVFAISLVFRIAVWSVPTQGVMDGHVFDSFLLTHAGALALGAALALAVRGSRAGTVARFAPAALLAGLLVYFGMSWLCGTFLVATRAQLTWGLAGVSVAAAALVELAQRPGFAGGLFRLAPLRWMGRISYGFYIFHILLQPLFDRIARRIAPPTADYNSYLTARFIAAFLITLIVAWLSWRFFEQPILALKRRFPMHSALP